MLQLHLKNSLIYQRSKILEYFDDQDLLQNQEAKMCHFHWSLPHFRSARGYFLSEPDLSVSLCTLYMYDENVKKKVISHPNYWP